MSTLKQAFLRFAFKVRLSNVIEPKNVCITSFNLRRYGYDLITRVGSAYTKVLELDQAGVFYSVVPSKRPTAHSIDIVDLYHLVYAT